MFVFVLIFYHRKGYKRNVDEVQYSLLQKIPRWVIEKLPGTSKDRKTIFGELYWIFTAVTDAIAWSSFDRNIFKRLFRK